LISVLHRNSVKEEDKKVINKRKKEYIKEFLICCLESSSLYEFYTYTDTELSSFKDLFNIIIYLINKGIVICYDEEGLLSSQKAYEYLKIEENWKKIIEHGELVLVEEPGFRYFNKQIYETEIDNGDFPNFKMKEIL
jgi:hypothetical protein